MRLLLALALVAALSGCSTVDAYDAAVVGPQCVGMASCFQGDWCP